MAHHKETPVQVAPGFIYNQELKYFPGLSHFQKCPIMKLNSMQSNMLWTSAKNIFHEKFYHSEPIPKLSLILWNTSMLKIRILHQLFVIYCDIATHFITSFSNGSPPNKMSVLTG